jgi:hypothetical protein
MLWSVRKLCAVFFEVVCTLRLCSSMVMPLLFDFKNGCLVFMQSVSSGDFFVKVLVLLHMES